MLKKIAMLLALMLLVTSSALADTAVDTIMNVGTTQAFSDEAVSTDDLKTILQAGLAASSAINQQPWFFVAITNREVMDEITGSGMSFAPPAGAPGKGDAPGAPEKGDAPGGDASFPAPSASSGGAKAGMGDPPAAIIIYRNDPLGL